MEHGRDHDEREYKIVVGRTSRTSRVTEAEAESDEPEVQARTAPQGSEPAPTQTAQRREAARHLHERAIGHIAAGTAGRKRAENGEASNRKGLDAAAREADEEMEQGAEPKAKQGKKPEP